MILSLEIWVIIALLCLIIEIFTAGFAVACFSIGALAAAVSCCFHCSLIWQVIFFAIFSFVAFVFVRPLIIKYFFKSDKNKQTNADALIGRKGKVTTDIDPATGFGRVAIDGDDWKAVSVDGSFIPKGAAVEVISIESIIITVKSI